MSINNQDLRPSSISESSKLGSSLTSKINLRKSSYFALRLTALIALVGLRASLASLGGAHRWSRTRALSKWTPIGAEIGCGVSGGSQVLVAIAIRKTESKAEPIPATESKE